MIELWTMSPKRNEAIRAYCDQFSKLMRECGINDDHDGIVSKFIGSLPAIFQEKILMVKAANPMYALTTVTAVVDLVISLEASIKLIPTTSINNKPKNEDTIMSNRSMSRFYCTYHGHNGTHPTTECKVVQAQSNNSRQSSISPRVLTPSSPAHTAVVNKSTTLANNMAKGYTCFVYRKAGHIAKDCQH